MPADAREERERLHGKRYPHSGRRSRHSRHCFRDLVGRRTWHPDGQEFRRGLGRDWREASYPRLPRYMAARIKARRSSIAEIIKEQNPSLPVVMISGHGNIETAVSAIKLGAYDFIEKPFKADRLVLVAERALEASRLKREVTELRTRAGRSNKIIGKSTVINQLRQVVERVGPANSRVLITGAPGAGKELTARGIHDASARANGPFITINSATISPETMETELFGSKPRRDAAVRSARSKKPMAARSISTKSPICPGKPRAKSCGSWSNRIFCGLEERPRPCRCPPHFVKLTRSSKADRRRLVSRGIFSTVLPSCRFAFPQSANTGRYSRTHRLFHGAAFDYNRYAQAFDRRRRHGGSAIA